MPSEAVHTNSMVRIKRNDVADVPVGSEGGRSPSALSTGQNGAGAGFAASGPLTPGQRWSVSRKRELVLRLLRGEAAEDLSRELGVPLYKLERWRQKAEAALDGFFVIRIPVPPTPRPSRYRRRPQEPMSWRRLSTSGGGASFTLRSERASWMMSVTIVIDVARMQSQIRTIKGPPCRI